MLFSASAILAVSVILLMLSVPLTGEWKNFRTVRLCLAFTCLVLSASDFVSCFAMDSNQEAQLFSTLTLIVASYQAMLFTTASLVFVQSARWASLLPPEFPSLCRNTIFPVCSRSCLQRP